MPSLTLIPNMQPQQPQTAAIPTASTPAQTQGGGTAEDYLNSLLKQKEQTDAQVAAATKQALTPTSRKGPGTSPGLSMNPIPGWQNIPFQRQQTVGRKANKQQNIAQVVTAAANAVGQFTTAKEQAKQRTQAVDLERVFQSVSGIQDAQDALKVDPNNAQAKQTLEKNQNILNSVLEDDKRRKAIAKSLDISFTDPSSNSGPDHQALKQATQSYAEQLMKNVPENMQPNPQAIQQLQVLQAQQKATDDMIGKVAPSVIRGQNDMQRQALHETQENNRAYARMQTDLQKSQNEILGRYQTAMAVAKDKDTSAMLRTQVKGQLDFERTMAGIRLRENLISNRGLSGDKRTAAIQKSYALTQKQSSDATDQINKLEQERDRIQNPNGKSGPHMDGNDPSLQPYNQQINYWENQLKVTKDLMDKYQKILSPDKQSSSSSSSSDDSDIPGMKKNASGGYDYTGPVAPFRPSQEGGSDGSSTKFVGQSEDDSSVDDSDIYGIDDSDDNPQH